MPGKKAPLRKITAELFRPKVVLTADIVPILQRRAEEDEARRRQEEGEEKALLEAAQNDPKTPPAEPSLRVKRTPFWLRPIKSIGRGMTLIDNVVFTKAQIEQFWSQVRKTPNENDCWVWTGECQQSGFGLFRAKYKRRKTAPAKYAHRIAFMLENDQVESGTHIIQKCGLAPCCNPKHLRPGTAEEYDQQKAMHKAMVKSLSETDRQEIKTSAEGMVELARRYRVTTGIVWAVKFGNPGARREEWWRRT